MKVRSLNLERFGNGSAKRLHGEKLIFNKKHMKSFLNKIVDCIGITLMITVVVIGIVSEILNIMQY